MVSLSLTTSPHVGAVPGEGYAFAFGVREGATDAYSEGEGDSIAPPDPIVGINAYFHYPANALYERNLVTSIVGPGPVITWPMIVKSVGDPGATEVTLVWDAEDMGDAPGKYAVLELRDTEGTVLCNMREEASFTFTLQSGETIAFHIVAADKP